MNANEMVQVFSNPEFGDLRVLLIDGDPWAVGKDVAAALGYERPTKAIRDHVDAEDKMMGAKNGAPPITDSMGRTQYPTWINESGLYSLIFSSRLSGARRFKRWVTSEVLPALHRAGSYTMPGTEPGITVEQVMRASDIVRTCPADRLHIVESLLRQGGFDIPIIPPAAVEHSERREREDWAAEAKGRMFKSGISNEELAKEAGFSAAYISTALNGGKPHTEDGKAAMSERVHAALDRLEEKARQSAFKQANDPDNFDWEKLLRHMENKGIRVCDLAEKTSFDPRAISRFRHGKATPTRNDRRKICKALGVSETYFDKAN